jgi:hypothetical protein
VPKRRKVGAVRSTGESLREYGRGVAGGLLFSLPLLYTVEVWHAVPIYLDLPDGRREEAELNIAFLPRDSKRDGWVSFREDPRRGTLSLGAVAFEVP